jgi:leader peptidase (prepilin peptidase)/N-methyltransferase
LLLRGKAACCGARISVQYVIIELFTAILFVLIYWQFPFVQKWDGALVVDAEEMIRFFHAAVLLTLLLICSVIDLHRQIIPDVLSLPLIALTPVVVYFHPDLDVWSAFWGVVGGGGVLYIIAWLYYFARREAGLGFGDVKFLAGIGGWLGYQSLFPTLFVASITGALTGLGIMLVTRSADLKTRLPFGPFLALGATIHLLFGQELQELLWTRGG